MTPDQSAALLLNSARKAYNEKEYAFAAGRFREFLAKFGSHKDAASARYGLALALLEGPDKDYSAAAAELQQLAANKDLPDYPSILYYLGQAQRGLGIKAQAEALAKPAESAQQRVRANQLFEEAGKQFAAALTAFSAKLPKAEELKPGAAVPVELDWAARARCALAEMQLRTQKPKEAQATTLPFAQDRLLARSRYRDLGLYYHGFASFLLKDYLSAGKSLNPLTPFQDAVFGGHARYLLARTHHLQDERAEAALHYEGILTDHAKHKQAAVEALKKPEQFKNNPEEKTRLEALVKEPPDHVARAAFFLGVLRYEDGKFAEALPRFADFAKTYPGSPLANEALLRQGFCQVQLKQYKEALATLDPLAIKDPLLADQAFLWIGKAQAGAADPSNAQAHDQALKTALETYKKALERVQQIIASGDAQAQAAARPRRGPILLELADTQQLAKQYKEAATTYAQILTDKALPERAEEVLQRQATALHLAGDYAESDQACLRFRQTYPKSTLLPAVLFRFAENAYFIHVAAEKNPKLDNREQELARLNNETIKRYQEVVDKYPQFQFINLARYGLGLAYYRKGEIDSARQVLETVPPAERSGGLAVASYLLADCLIRQTPVLVEDALSAGRAQAQLQTAVQQLENFIAAQPTSAQAPDALFKLGHCNQRLAALLAQPAERTKVLAAARAAYERLINQFPNQSLQAQAIIERARCSALAGEVSAGMTELERFKTDPLKSAPVAPMALLQLATLLRGQNRPADAAQVLAQCRQQYEPSLLNDPARAGWVPLLQYHHGVALREAGKLPEARAIFELAVKQTPQRLESAEAALRIGQCLREEGIQKIAAARKTLATANLKPPEEAGARKLLNAGLDDVRASLKHLEGHINQLKDKQPTWDARARMLYEAAWASRTLAEFEVAAARDKIQEERWKKLQDDTARNTPPGAPPPLIQPPEVPLSAVPLQPAEKNTRELYQALLTTFSDAPLATIALFELAELYAERAEYDEAVKLLNAAVEREPAGALLDKVRLRMGECLAEKGDVKSALREFETLAGNPKGPLAAQGHYRAGECWMQLKDYNKAITHFATLRDQAPFQNLPGLSDRSLLRLGQAHAELKQWDLSRQAYELLLSRFAGSPLVNEARYGIGWAYQNTSGFDQAIGFYAQVTANCATETAAKAQLQIGQCHLAQKRYPEAATAFLVVPFTYDYPELSAAALCEAARTFTEMKQKDQAIKLLERVLKDHPRSKWAEAARERLEKLR